MSGFFEGCRPTVELILTAKNSGMAGERNSGFLGVCISNLQKRGFRTGACHVGRTEDPQLIPSAHQRISLHLRHRSVEALGANHSCVCTQWPHHVLCGPPSHSAHVAWRHLLGLRRKYPIAEKMIQLIEYGPAFMQTPRVLFGFFTFFYTEFHPHLAQKNERFTSSF